MGGPAAGILLPTELSQSHIQGLNDLVRQLDASARALDDFRVSTTRPIGGMFDAVTPTDARPVGVSVGQLFMESPQLESCRDAFGFAPRATIDAFAFYNDRVDHVVLAEIIVHMADAFGAVIDFSGDLGEELPRDGRVVNIAAPGESRWHVGDVAFARAWLRHRRFRMVK